MAETCWSSVRGKVARLTQTDDCCRPVAGPCGTIVTDGFVTVSYSPEIEEGEEILVKKANGAICVNDKSCDTLKRVNVEVEFCQVSPSIFARMTGNPVVTDFGGTPVGNRIGETVRCDIGFALEVWSDVPGARCTTTGRPQYGYFLVPCLTGGTIQDFTIENDAATFTVTGYSRPAQGWGTGPYDVDAADADNTAGPLLTPFGREEHMDMHLTTIAPPESRCECEELVLPERYTTDTDLGGTFDAYDEFPNDRNQGVGEPDQDRDGVLDDEDFAPANPAIQERPTFPDFPAERARWSRSRNAGSSYTRNPPAQETSTPVGPNGTMRYKVSYTIPAGVGGTYDIIARGDVTDGNAGSIAELFVNGVSQGTFPADPVGAPFAPRTFTVPAAAGNVDVEVRIGGTAAGNTTDRTNLEITFDEAGLTPV